MVRYAVPIAVGLLVGWFAADLGIGLAAPLLAVAAFYGSFYLYAKLWARPRYHRTYLAYARKHLDPQAGPPADAMPVELPLARRVSEIDEHDSDAIRALYTEDCRIYMVGMSKPRSLDEHMKARRITDGLLGETTSSYTTTVADPREQDGFWLLGEMHVRPRRGEPFELKWVEAWTLTPGRDRIQSRAIVAFTDVAVATRSA